MGGSRVWDRGSGPPPPLKNHQNIGFLSKKQYWSGSPEKTQGYQAYIQCWVIIGTPGQRQWCFAGGQIIAHLSKYLDPLINCKKCCQNWTPLTKHSGSAHEIHILQLYKLRIITILIKHPQVLHVR